MKLFSLLLILAIASSIHCLPNPHKNEKRFIGWINDNIIKPIGDGINTGINVIGDGINTGINVIGDGINTGINSIDGSVIKPIGGFFEDLHGSILKPTLDLVVNMGSLIINGNFKVKGPPTSSAQIQVEDKCATTCFQRVKLNEQVTDYFFDKPNGCVSKGWLDSEVKLFDTCCDSHNSCLNKQCCTTNCQELKNECDTSFYHCMKRECYIKIDYMDNNKMNRCVSNAGYVANVAINRTCSSLTNDSRKVCYC